MNNFYTYAMQSWEFEGQSAKTLYATHNGHLIDCNYPHDPDDLCRCIQVLRLLFQDNQLRKMSLMKEVARKYKSREWRLLNKNWEQLIEIFESEWGKQSAPKTYQFMQDLYNE